MVIPMTDMEKGGTPEAGTPMERRLGEYASLSELQQYMTEMYEHRSQEYLPRLSDRIDFFEEAAADLMGAVRADDFELKEIAVARLGSRLFCVASGLGNIPVHEGLEAKYPATGCARCGAIPCSCGDKESQKPELDLTSVGMRSEWSMNRWQRFLWDVYGENNQRRGIKDTIARLFSEVVEVRALVRQAPKLGAAEVARAARLEIADVTAWSLGAASLLGVFMQPAIIERYGAGCPTCGGQVCHCTPEQFDHVWSPIY